MDAFACGSRQEGCSYSSIVEFFSDIIVYMTDAIVHPDSNRALNPTMFPAVHGGRGRCGSRGGSRSRSSRKSRRGSTSHRRRARVTKKAQVHNKRKN